MILYALVFLVLEVGVMALLGTYVRSKWLMWILFQGFVVAFLAAYVALT